MEQNQEKEAYIKLLENLIYNYNGRSYELHPAEYQFIREVKRQLALLSSMPIHIRVNSR